METTWLVLGLVVGLLLGGLVGVTAGLLLAPGAGRLRGGRTEPSSAVGELALALVPLTDALERVRARVDGLDRERAVAAGALAEQVRAVQQVGARLSEQTTTLSGALRSTTARGSWGEVQLQRVVEVAGMLRHVDFSTQQGVLDDEGRRRRPDLVVRLPGERVVVVDAKAPLVLPTGGEDADRHARSQAVALRAHVDALSGKAYWRSFERSPELVVCFVPSESVLASALTADPQLLDDALRAKVVPASPATLLALLRTIAVTWREQAVTDSATEVLRLGQELHQRLTVVLKHADALGRGLNRSVEDYNRLLASIESRLLVTSRRMDELDLVDGALSTPPTLSVSARPATVPPSAFHEGDGSAVLDGAEELAVLDSADAGEGRDALDGLSEDQGPARDDASFEDDGFSAGPGGHSSRRPA